MTTRRAWLASALKTRISSVGRTLESVVRAGVACAVAARAIRSKAAHRRLRILKLLPPPDLMLPRVRMSDQKLVGGRYQLWTMNPDGTDPVQLTFPPRHQLVRELGRAARPREVIVEASVLAASRIGLDPGREPLRSPAAGAKRARLPA